MNERFTGTRRSARVELLHEPKFALGVLRVNPAHCEVIGPGWSETLEPRVMQVLVALAREKGEVVSRDELIDACWEGYVVGEDSISRCIGRLRKLAEKSNGAFTVHTVSRVGYRLKIAEAVMPEPPIPPAPQAAVAPLSPALRKPPWTVRTKWIASTLAALVLLAAGFGVWRLLPAKTSIGPALVESSVAVLPFVNMSGDPAKDYLSDGFSEELLDDLSEDPRLRVVARTSSFAFKGTNKTIDEIARDLHVGAIVEGSVREAGNHVRITAELVNSASSFRIWSATYDRDLADILAVENDVARAIASALTHRLIPGAAPGAGRRIDPQTYRQYLQARQYLDENTPASAHAAVALLTLVTRREPTFAEGFGALARSQRYVEQFDAFSRYGLDPANQSAQRALALDPHNLEARAEREAYELDRWDWNAAATDLQVLMHANADNYHRLNGLRIYYYDLGFPEQALAVAMRIAALEPETTARRRQVVDYLNRAGASLDAVKWVRKIVQREPNRTDMLDEMCTAYAFSGQIRQAREIVDRLRRLASDTNSRYDFQDCAFLVDVATHDLAAAHRIVEGFEAQFPDNYSRATLIGEDYVYLHDFDKASDWFERSYEQRDGDLFHYVYWGPGEEYHKTARWKALTQQPLFKKWQAEHDRIAAVLAAHRNPLN